MDKLCECGCGQPTPVAKRTYRKKGIEKGEPLRFIYGHSGAHQPPPIDPDVVGYCACGCGEQTNVPTRTWPQQKVFRGVPMRYVRGHNTRSAERWREQDRGFATPCWIWLLGKDRDGYGKTTWRGVDVLAHRMTFEQENGPIPAGLQIDHLCRQRDCVNPAHLEAVTCAVNIQRGHASRRS